MSDERNAKQTARGMLAVTAYSISINNITQAAMRMFIFVKTRAKKAEEITLAWNTHRESINTVNEFVLAFIIVVGCRNHDVIPQKVLFIATFTKYSLNEIINWTHSWDRSNVLLNSVRVFDDTEWYLLCWCQCIYSNRSNVNGFFFLQVWW